MPLYDNYARYRLAPDAEDEQKLADARTREQTQTLDLGIAYPDTFRWTDGCFVDPTGKTHVRQTVRAHMEIALKHAQQQLSVQDAPMPEDEESSLRFPGISPKGKHSVIEMKLAQRWDDANAYGQFCDTATRQVVAQIVQSPYYDQIRHQLTTASAQHQRLSRASKLCRNEDGRRLLHGQARALENGDSVVRMGQLMQGIEYLYGMRLTVPEDVAQLYRDRLGLELSQQPRQRVVPQTLQIRFHDFDEILTQHAFADPRNWGIPTQQLRTRQPEAEEANNALRPYAISSVQRTLTPLLANIHASGMDYRDLLIVDGQTVRQHLDEADVGELSQEALEIRTSTMIATALMTGKRVEAFIPDAHGRLPQTPTAIRRHSDSYVPERSGPVVMSLWQRFCAKLGFYKTEVAQKKEHDQAMAARAEVLDAQEERRTAYLLSQCRQPEVYGDLFFGGMKEQFDAAFTMNRQLCQRRQEPSYYMNPTRSSPASACVWIMASHYPLKDIFDPNKLQDIRRNVARTYLEKVAQNDYEWITAVTRRGVESLERQMRGILSDTDLKDPHQRRQALPLLRLGALAGFDASQDLSAVQRNHRDHTTGAPDQRPHREQMDPTLLSLTRISGLVDTLENGCKARVALLDGQVHQNSLSQLLVSELQMELVDRTKDPVSYALEDRMSTSLVAVLGSGNEIPRLTEAIRSDASIRHQLLQQMRQHKLKDMIRIDNERSLLRCGTQPMTRRTEDIIMSTTVSPTKLLPPTLQSVMQAPRTQRTL